MSGAFYRLDKLPLVPGTGAGNSFRDDFTLFGYESRKFLFVFIIDVDFLAIAKTTGSTFLELLVLFCHGYPYDS
jgi:hypothetical protein